MLQHLRDWLPLAAVIALGLGYVGYLAGTFRKGKDAATAAREARSTAAIAAQSAQIEAQDKIIAGMKYELSTLREEMTKQQTQIAALQAELTLTKQMNAELNQMPPKDQLAAVAADAVMNITELIGERLTPIERSVDRLLAMRNGEPLA